MLWLYVLWILLNFSYTGTLFCFIAILIQIVMKQEPFLREVSELISTISPSRRGYKNLTHFSLKKGERVGAIAGVCVRPIDRQKTQRQEKTIFTFPPCNPPQSNSNKVVQLRGVKVLCKLSCPVDLYSNAGFLMLI